MKYYVLFFFSKLLDLFIRFFFGKNYFDSVLKKNFYFGNSILVFRTYQKNLFFEKRNSDNFSIIFFRNFNR